MTFGALLRYMSNNLSSYLVKPRQCLWLDLRKRCTDVESSKKNQSGDPTELRHRIPPEALFKLSRTLDSEPKTLKPDSWASNSLKDDPVLLSSLAFSDAYGRGSWGILVFFSIEFRVLGAGFRALGIRLKGFRFGVQSSVKV